MGPLRNLTLGALALEGDRCQFRVWAPQARKVEVRLLTPRERLVPLRPAGSGYHAAVVEGVPPGSRYLYRLDGDRERPDPVSRYQPEGVHGPSAVVERHFDWHDAGWFGLPLSAYVLYELHVGTFTPEGTFDAIIPHLDRLRDLGITALELMPVAQFPGSRNWGYDGVYPFAVQASYGGPAGLKRLVDACHGKGLAVVLDVVYNHLGPEGNYLGAYAPYFTDRYRTPWGQALNYDGPESDEVRRYFIENALQWLTDFHLDALRLDAVHAIRDFSAEPFLAELEAATTLQAERLNRRFYLIAESDLNDARLILPRELGGYGLHAQWSDDFHHALRTLLTGERCGYFEDFGSVEHLARAYRDGYVYAGQYSPHRRRRHGNTARLTAARQFVVFASNHDQVGNRREGDRLSAHLGLDGLKLAAAAVLLSPYVPLLFMGEEYGETAPFQFFTSHGDPDLVEAVRQGRRAEFAAFAWEGEVPDPQDEATFLRSKLCPTEGHRALWEFTRELLRLRRTVPALALLSREHLEVVCFEPEKCLLLRRWADDDAVFLVFNFKDAAVELQLPVPPGRWHKLLDAAAPQWHGPGSALPETLDADGDVRLTVGARACVVYRAAG